MDKEKKQDSNPDVVSSIFDRHKGSKQKISISSLFARTSGPGGQVRVKVANSTFASSVQRTYPIGLDIGSSAIKAVQLGRISKGNLQVVNLGVQPLTDDFRRLNEKEKTNLLTGTLKRFIQFYKIEGEVISSVPSSVAQIKRVDLPKMPENEIEGALRWEIQQGSWFDVGIDELSFDYIILHDTRAASDQKLKLLLVATPKKLIFEHLDMLESCGLDVKAVEVSPLACTSALNYIYKFNPNEVIAFLDFGAEMNSFNILTQNELHFSRNLYTTGNSLTKSICEDKSLDFKEAEKIKEINGLSGDISNIISSGLGDLISDIEHSFKYFSYKLSGSSIVKFDKLLLCGGAANLRGLAPFLQERFNVGVGVVNPFEKIAVSDSIRQRIVNLHEMTSTFTLALGLAVRDLENEKS